jgi:hypothetical protein
MDNDMKPSPLSIPVAVASVVVVLSFLDTAQLSISNGGLAYAQLSPPPPPNTRPPVLTVPEDMVVEATSEQVAQVTFTVTA